VGENLMPDVARMPERKLLKLHIKPFDGTEKYPGLGADIQRWGQQFLDEVPWAEIYSGFRWSEDIKLRVFRTKLDGMAVRMFEDSAEIWLSRSARIEDVMDYMLRRFCPKMTAEKAQKIYRQRKDRNRSWAEHLGMSLHVSALMEDNGQYVVENLVNFAMPSITALLMSHYDILPRDYKQMAEEIATYVEAFDSERVRVDYQARTGPREVIRTNGGICTMDIDSTTSGVM
jgi:hypothetical protein